MLTLRACQSAICSSSLVYDETSHTCGYKSPRSSGYAVRIAASVFAAARRTFQLTSSSSLYWSSLSLAGKAGRRESRAWDAGRCTHAAAGADMIDCWQAVSQGRRHQPKTVEQCRRHDQEQSRQYSITARLRR